MTTFSWTCAYCSKAQLASDENYDATFHELDIGHSIYGRTGITYTAIRCVERSCNQVTLSVRFSKSNDSPFNGVYEGDLIQRWQLMPLSVSKPLPDFIPATLREDYFEACLVVDKSPKASATLARRCLQGMIRDFCGISKSRLIDEINELRRHVEEGSAPRGVEMETVDAIDAVRRVGNIGAHMERDINIIIDVDEGEAQALIDLIEMLFDDWYISRHQRQQRLARVKAIAAEKAAELETEKARIAQEELVAITDQSGDEHSDK